MADNRSLFRQAFSVALLLLVLTLLPLVFPSSQTLSAQRRRDPLNPLEIDQLRDAMLDPDARLKLYVQFSRDRMTKLEQMRSDPKTKDRAVQTHDMLEDFLAVYDELNENVDMYVGRKDDIRKPLKIIIEADTEFQSKLRALKDSSNADAAEALGAKQRELPHHGAERVAQHILLLFRVGTQPKGLPPPKSSPSFESTSEIFFPVMILTTFLGMAGQELPSN